MNHCLALDEPWLTFWGHQLMLSLGWALYRGQGGPPIHVESELSFLFHPSQFDTSWTYLQVLQSENSLLRLEKEKMNKEMQVSATVY